MGLVKLSSKEVLELEQMLNQITDARLLHRIQALLWLDEGDSVEEVASHLRASRQSVYNWILNFNNRSAMSLVERIRDSPRRGRPPTALEIIDPLIAQVIEQDPRGLSYSSTIWTASLLQVYLCDKHQISVSTKSIHRALQRLGYAWKRPRHTLALRPNTWQQAKGG